MAGAAIIIIAMYLIRNELNLKKYITEHHFEKNGQTFSTVISGVPLL